MRLYLFEQNENPRVQIVFSETADQAIPTSHYAVGCCEYINGRALFYANVVGFDLRGGVSAYLRTYLERPWQRCAKDSMPQSILEDRTFKDNEMFDVDKGNWSYADVDSFLHQQALQMGLEKAKQFRERRLQQKNRVRKFVLIMVLLLFVATMASVFF